MVVNGDVVGPILPGRGLRQGDPLSPYLFILCAEGFSTVVKHENVRGLLHGLRVCRAAPAITHLLFADDCILFCRATRDECQKLKDVLHFYELVSGQAINYQKSDIFFSNNIGQGARNELPQIMGVWQPLNTGRYLGLPSLIGRNKKTGFGYLRDKLWGKLQSWRDKGISKARKEVLNKAAAQAIPAY